MLQRDVDPEESMIIRDGLKDIAARVRASLTKRELEILDMRFGLDSEIPDAERATTAQINAACDRALERLKDFKKRLDDPKTSG